MEESPPSVARKSVENLRSMYREHKGNQEKHSDVSKELHSNLKHSAHRLSDAMLVKVNSSMHDIFRRQKHLEQETLRVETQTKRLNKQCEKWLDLVEKFNRSLKELGDVEHWGGVIEVK